MSFLDVKSGAVRLLAFDYSKAFDKLPHASIIKSCIKCRVPSQCVPWLISYLSGRRQRVVIGDDVSSWVSPQSGVPQGSILGPLLFCCVMADLSPIHDNSMLIKYADDITLLHSVRSSSDDRLQEEFDNILSWSNEAGLDLNFSKCSNVNFVTRKSLSLNHVFDSTGVPLTICHTVKILGVIFSDDLRWNHHIDYVIRKASKRIFILRNLKRSGCNSLIMLRVYVSLIRSVLLYCYPSFCNAPSYLHETLSRVEKRVFKLVYNNHRYNNDMFNAAHNVCNNLFLKIHDCIEHPLRVLFSLREPSRSNRLCLRPPFAKTKRFHTSFIKFCKSVD
ncbi:MAG: reverse transcriptase domain-containing protein [Pseudomonadota bacterium]